MPIRGAKRRLNRKNIEQVPALSGVYGLYTDHGVAFYGVAGSDESIRDRLAAHLSGHEAPDPGAAQYFNFEVTRFPRSRECALLEEHRRANLRLPPFNDPLSPSAAPLAPPASGPAAGQLGRPRSSVLRTF